jgi:hypothetical protein
VINVIHEDYMQEVLSMLELYLETISVRLDIIAVQMYISPSRSVLISF